MDDILMGIPRLLCLRCCCYFKGDGVTFFDRAVIRLRVRNLLMLLLAFLQ